jgi:hypothetical protein
MSQLSSILKKIILWLLESGKMEFLIDLAKKVVARLENRDDLDSDEKRKLAKDEIMKKIRSSGREFTQHMINLAIELALIEFRQVTD